MKKLGNIDHDLDLISAQVIEPICKLKTENLGNHNPRLHSDEVLIALAASSVHSEPAKKAMESLEKLRGCGAHFSIILSAVDAKTYKKLGINTSCEPKYEHRTLYHRS